MGRRRRDLIAQQPSRPALPVETTLRRRKPRSYLEWKTLREWGKLPPWQEDPPGFLLRGLREDAGLSQGELGARLGCSQQAVAQAESWEANPTFKFVREWARALGSTMSLRFHRTGFPEAGRR